MKQQEQPEIIFVVENKLGGVAYLNKNIINNSSLKGNAYIKVILVNKLDSDHPRFTDLFEADEVINFDYGGYENKYIVLKRLSNLFGTSPGAIICNDALEMEAIYLHGTPKTTYQVIHDFYNLKLAVKYGAITDVFIAHTQLFSDVLSSSDPGTVQVYYQPHGVAIPAHTTIHEPSDKLKIVFTGRLVEAKGVQDLFEINQLLRRKGVEVEWTVIGRGALRNFLGKQWKGENNIRFAAPDTNEEVMQLMGSQDIFMLPTRFEGSPVTVLEALSVGLVPVISDLPGGIREIVAENIGIRVPLGNNELFAVAVESLHNNRLQLMRMKMAASSLAKEQFDIGVTSNNYFKLFLQYKGLKKVRNTLTPIHIGFRLDKPWIPNALVSFLRKK